MRLTALATMGALLFAVPAFAQDPGEITFWQSVKDSKNAAELQAYLQAYPHGTYAVLARLRMQELGTARPVQTTPAPAPAAQAAPPSPPAETTQPKPATPALAENPPEPFRSAEGRFSVAFPGEPEEKVSPTDASGHSEHRFGVERDGAVFMVAYDDFAPGKVAPNNAPEVLNRAQQALIDGMHGKLREETAISLDGLPGRQIAFETPDGVGKLRVYVGQNRMYQVLFIGPAGRESSPGVARFFDSFRLRANASAESAPPPGAETAAPPAKAAGATADGLHWHAFRAASAGFEVEMPGEVKANEPPPKPNGRSESRWLVDQGDTAWFVSLDRYPPGQLTHADPKALLDAAQQAVLAGLHGKLRERRPLSLSGYAGREIVFDTPDHNTGKVRIYVVRNRLYQEWYLGPSGHEGPAVDRFLNSFRLIPG